MNAASGHDGCMMLLARIAVRRHRFLSNLPKEGRYTAENVIRNTEEDNEMTGRPLAWLKPKEYADR